MFSKFKLDATNCRENDIDNYYQYGKNDNEINRNRIKRNLDSYIDYNTGIIDGDKMEKELFAEINADIFISHSHQDEKLAISIAGWLKREVGLTSFVDSCVWNYADDILSEINDKYNMIRKEPNGSKTYDHSKANYAASHVYLMLNSALNNMINKTECLMFINTSNSIIQMDKDKAKGQTLSPWIYSEIVMANTMKPIYPRGEMYFEKRAMVHEDMRMKHELDFSDFISINLRDFTSWKNNIRNSEHPLDALYKLINKRGILHG